MQAEITGPDSNQIRHGRGGRPPAEQAGDVDRRILAAATEIFLLRGYDAANTQEIAVKARAGKASIYARYASKEALFAAVVRTTVDRVFAPSTSISLDHPLHDRLRMVGHSIISNALRPEVVAVMRAIVSTTYRMPDLARNVHRFGRDRAIERIVVAIAGQEAVSAATRERAMPVAGTFFDLTFATYQARALLGGDALELQADALRGIDAAVELLAKGGLLGDWT